LRSVVALLSPALGWDKSEEVVADLVRTLRLAEPLTGADAEAILDSLSRTPGMVGVAARVARSRQEWSHELSTPTTAEASDPVSRRPTSHPLPPTQAARPAAPMFTRQELTALLAQNIGREQSAQAIRNCATRLSLPEGPLDQHQATLLLEELARQKGLVGISARFAKARLILRIGR
jgi:hypothetical protein